VTVTGKRSVIGELLEQLADLPESAQLKHWLAKLDNAEAAGAERLIEGYQTAADLVEQVLWRTGCTEDLLLRYQRLYREMESRLAAIGKDRRFAFVVVIPVADRPQHLQNCLASLLTLCERFGYGGIGHAGYRKVRVLVADDSRQPVNIRRHQGLADEFTRQGLNVLYFGQQQQLQELERFTLRRRQALSRILGDNDPQAFYHKGASITRNLAYLKLAELAQADRHQLFWFMDSDQEFCVNTPKREGRVYAINYFQRLDQIFSDTDVQVLTGKVVGDPPVSPAVMASNMIGDVIAFLGEMAGLAPRDPCRFHRQARDTKDQAAYHDMADLFGFKPAAAARYHCGLTGAHDHAACCADFAARLNRFFDGEHPTRQTNYEHQSLLDSLKSARTVYTGNYVLTADALQYFIPFPTLKLRMAGPVLGRILQARLGGRFASANLPLLHKRTLDELGQSEFRPGIDRDDQRVDLSGEFERQFYGDVMLFTIERLSREGYPFEPVTEDTLAEVLNETEASLRQRYTDKHEQIRARLNELQALFSDPQRWWNQDPTYTPMQQDMLYFIQNMQANFGVDSPAYRMIHSSDHRRRRLQVLLKAIRQLPQDRAEWMHTLVFDR
jgi:hypothetical protein